jgi:hypothetical protein
MILLPTWNCVNTSALHGTLHQMLPNGMHLDQKSDVFIIIIFLVRKIHGLNYNIEAFNPISGNKSSSAFAKLLS